MVLIETLWNVKMQNYRHRIKPTSINRNIVECKGRSNKKIKIPRAVLIETLWNVKSAVCGQPGNGVCRINRNIVECKVVLSGCPALSFGY